MASLVRYTRKIFVGDLHGCFDEMMALLARLNHDPSRDELYFVGDLCVKGPDSEKCVDFVMVQLYFVLVCCLPLSTLMNECRCTCERPHA